MSKSGRDRGEENELGGILLAFGAFFGIIITLGWLVAGNQLVIWTIWIAPYLSKPYLWFGSIETWNGLVQTSQKFISDPAAASFGSWITFVSVMIRPWSIFFSIVLIFFAVMAVRSSRKYVANRKFDADSLMRVHAMKFTSLLPVLHIRKQIADDSDPLWRTQVWPEEIFNTYRVPKHSAAPDMPAGMPMVHDGVFDREVAATYFRGIKEQRLKGGRFDSVMLGRQIVDIVSDIASFKNTIFSDRMSDLGKTLVALWVPVAFGGEEGRKEYFELRDKLNRSSIGSASGVANLTVAQAQYEKYRVHPKLNTLFGIHHWEYTFLWALLQEAQRHWKVVTADCLWLRPMNRQLFAAMNARGMDTPHTEAAATFCQFEFERMCAKADRVPLATLQGGSELIQVICIEPAVDALQAAWQHWQDGKDILDPNWWMDKDPWRTADETVSSLLRQSIPKSDMPGISGQTNFDIEMQKEESSNAFNHEYEAPFKYQDL